MWKLREGWRADVEDGNLIIFSDTRRFLISTSTVLPKEVATELELGFRDLPTALSHDLGMALLSKLQSKNLLISLDAVDSRPMILTARQSAYFEHIGLPSSLADTAFKATRVLILGLGGTGSILLQHLVGSGIHHFVLVDHDNIEEFNLERQFIYRYSTIGQPKTTAAADYAVRRTPHADIQQIRDMLLNYEDVQAVINRAGKVDLAAICLDQPPGTSFGFSSSALWDAGIPFSHAGVLIRSCFFGPFFERKRSPYPPASFSITDFAPLDTEFPRPAPICFPPYNTIAGAHLAADLLHWIVGRSELIDFGRRTFVDFDRLMFTKLGPNTLPNE